MIETRLQSLFQEYLAQPSDEKISDENWDHDVVDWYDRHLKRSPYRWDDFHQAELAFNLLKKFTESYARSFPSGRLIDIGCGSGAALSIFERLGFSNNGSLFGIDFSKEGLTVAKDRAPSSTLYQGDFLKFDFGKPFEFVVSLGVYEHLTNPVDAFRRTKDILTKDGLAYILVPSFDSARTGITEKFCRPSQGRQLQWLLDKASWHEAIEASGLVIVKNLKMLDGLQGFAWFLARPDSVWAMTGAKSPMIFDSFYYRHALDKGVLRPIAKKLLPKSFRQWIRGRKKPAQKSGAAV